MQSYTVDSHSTISFPAKGHSTKPGALHQVVLEVLLQFSGKLFRMFEVFSVRSALVYSSEQSEETVGVKTCAYEFIDDM